MCVRISLRLFPAEWLDASQRNGDGIRLNRPAREQSEKHFQAVIRIGYCALPKQVPLPFRKRYCENPVQMCLYKYFRLTEFLESK